MSSRVSRKSITTTTVSQSASGSETPSKSASSPGRRGRSPSPARLLRHQEKEQLQNLNDRLAAYIDRVRYLESENSRLQVQVRSTEETVTREVTNIKALYETELAEARKLLDETAKEKAKLQIDADKYKTLADDWQSKYHRRDRDAKNAEKKVLDLQAELSDMAGKSEDADNKRKHAEAEAARLRGENAQLERQLAQLRKQLEEEMLQRVDLENRLQSLKEELTFKDTIHEQELNETRTRVTQEVEEVDAGVREDYETKLADALRQMREEQEDQIRQVREEVEIMYERKVQDLQGALDRSMSTGSSSREDLILSKRKVDELASEVTSLKAQLAAYEKRIRDLEAQLDSEQDLFEQRLLQKDVEISELRSSLDEQTREYADLLDIKLRLDTEIEAYGKLLESEETRLNLSHSSSETPRKGGRGQKRKRVQLSETLEEMTQRSGSDFASQAKGPVEINDVDSDGQYIKLYNNSDNDVTIGGWQLQHSAGDDETNYKFHRNLKLPAGHYVTVWSSDAGQTHSPPSDLVMKGQRWFTGDNMKTVLIGSGKEVATREVTKSGRSVVSSSSSQRRLRGRSGFDETDGKDDRCSVM